MRLIQGASGGGGGGGKEAGGSGRAPIESPDSLRSRQYARVVDLLSEGEILGLANGLQSIYLNDTPVQNADGSYNFGGVSWAIRVGTQSQSHIPGFAAVEAETAVSVPVEAAAPVVRSISNVNANAVRVTISVPKLTEQNTSNGDLGGTSVSIAIDVQTAGGGYVHKISDTISGKTTSRYQRSYRIELTGTGPWDVRVRRLTADSTSSTLNNTTNWDSYTEIIDAKLRYPNSALLAISVDSERFNSIPKRGYEIRGLLVRIPSNYNPTTRAYTGIWDGTFTTAWTDNPAWHFYDMVTNDRYGLGSYIDPSQVDKWVLYEIAQHCDELVPNGYGGMEPRFTCSLYLQSREEAFKVINDMAAIFCGIAYWGAGSIIPAQDAPSEPVKLFSNANVVPSSEGMYFNYAGSSVKTRHTVALVSWNDPADRYRQKIEYVEDLEGIALYGIVQTEVVALGCTSRGQAHRYGKRILYTERMETETISFRAGLDGLDLAPGDVFQTSDPVRAGVRLGGRLIDATANTLTLDAAVTIDGATTYTLWAVLPNGAVESRAVVTGAGTTSVLSVSPDFSDAPQAMAMWVLAASNVAPETWRAISISEADGGTVAEISALKYSPNKYLEIEQGIVLEALPTSLISTTQAAPTGLVISEDLYFIAPGVVGARITASWQGNAAKYEMQYRVTGGNWITLSGITTSSVDIQPVEPGTYEFTLTAISTLGVRSAPVQATKEIFGKTAPPSNVVSFLLDGGKFTWPSVSDLDLAGYEIRFNYGVNTWWPTATPLHSGLITDSPYPLSARLPGVVTFLLKAVDTSGNFSTEARSIVANLGEPVVSNLVESYPEGPLFAGEVTGASRSGGFLLADGLDSFFEPAGEPMFSPDLEDFYPAGLYGDITYVWSHLAAGEGTLLCECDVIGSRYTLEYRRGDQGRMFSPSTDLMFEPADAPYFGDPSGWSVWTGSLELEAPELLQFRLVVTGGDVRGEVRALTLLLDVPDLLESFDNLPVSAVGTRLPLTKAYRVIKNVQITVQADGGSGLTARAEDKHPTLGPLIAVYDAAGTQVSGLVDVEIQGY